MKPFTLVITGANGFVGKHLHRYLESKGHTVWPLRRQQVDLLDGRAVKDYLRNIDFDVIIHCAAIVGTRQNSYNEQAPEVLDSNLRMFLNIEHCLRPGQRMIHLGSGAEYDRRCYRAKMTEACFNQSIPEDSYGFSKYIISRMIAQRSNILCLRLFGIFGPYDDYRYKFISNAIVKNLAGLPIIINQDVVFDYLYITDFVKIVERLLSLPWPDWQLNITPTDSNSLLQIAELINTHSKAPSEIKVINSGMNTEYTGSNEALLRLIGEYQFISMENAIREMRSFYEDHFEELDIEIVRQDPFISSCRTRV